MNKRFPFVPEGWSLDLYKDVGSYNAADWSLEISARRTCYRMLTKLPLFFDLAMRYFIDRYDQNSDFNHGMAAHILTEIYLDPLYGGSNEFISFSVEEIDSDAAFQLRDLFMNCKEFMDHNESLLSAFLEEEYYPHCIPEIENMKPLYEIIPIFRANPLLRINLEVPDEKLKEDFSKWLNKARASRNVALPVHHQNKKSENPKITKADLRRWVKNRVLPYIDLRHSAMRYGWAETTWSIDDRKDSRLTTAKWIELLYSDLHESLRPDYRDFKDKTVDQARWLMNEPDALKLLAIQAI